MKFEELAKLTSQQSRFHTNHLYSSWIGRLICRSRSSCSSGMAWHLRNTTTSTFSSGWSQNQSEPARFLSGWFITITYVDTTRQDGQQQVLRFFHHYLFFPRHRRKQRMKLYEPSSRKSISNDKNNCGDFYFRIIQLLKLRVVFCSCSFPPQSLLSLSLSLSLFLWLTYWRNTAHFFLNISQRWYVWVEQEENGRRKTKKKLFSKWNILYMKRKEEEKILTTVI